MNTRHAPLLLALLLSACADDTPPIDDPAPTERIYQFRAIGGVSMGGYASALLWARAPERFDQLLLLGTALDPSGFVRGLRDLAGEWDHLPYNPITNASRAAIVNSLQNGSMVFGDLFYRHSSPYLPPGVPASYLALSPAEKCATPVQVMGLTIPADPGGTIPAITFCDIEDEEPPGEFDPALPAEVPVEVLLALDVDGDGMRDPGEPVVLHPGEPWDDDTGDRFDPWDNPHGTAGNSRWDPGEPFEDLGVDGVPGTAGSTYDYGEGNGVYDQVPGLDWVDTAGNPRTAVRTLDLDNVDIYSDVGIRDHLGFLDQTLAFFGELRQRGEDVHVYDGFESLTGGGAYEIYRADFAALGRHILVRYGDPDASASAIEAGDGGHVGTAGQVLQRMDTLIAFLSARWPDGDHTPTQGPSRLIDEPMYSAILDELREHVVLLPPGYDESEARYPVVYLLHGLGMDPSDLLAIQLFLVPAMQRGAVQKFITVFADGECRGGRCTEATFYLNHRKVDGTPGYRYQDEFLDELMPAIDALYRTKGPAPAQD